MLRPQNQQAGSMHRLWQTIPWLLVLIMAVMQGCSSGWQAPLEVRGESPRRSPTPPPDTLSGSSYKVHKGDTLFSIAWRAGQDMNELASWNGIRSPYTIYPGQVLRLRPPTAVPRKTIKKTQQKRAGTSSKSLKQSAAKTKKTTSSKPQTQGKTADRLYWAWPTEGPLISTFSAKEQTRQGIKISGKEGQAIKAAEKGKVVYSGSGLIGYGRLIIIKHNDNYLSAYGHNRQLLVKEGDQVSKGDRIAVMGRSNEGKPMLHFEIRRVGKPVDPLRLLPKQKG